MPKYDVTNFPFVLTFISGMSSVQSYVLNRDVTESIFSGDKDTSTVLDFKLSPCFDCSLFSFG